MKHRVLVQALALGLVTGGIFCNKPPPIDSAQPSVIIDAGKITINGTQIVLDTPLTDWTRLLGPSRHVERAGGTEVWDELGIFAVLGSGPTEQRRVRSLALVLNTRAIDIRPRKSFRGKLVVNGFQLHRESSDSEVRRAWEPIPPPDDWKRKDPRRESTTYDIRHMSSNWKFVHRVGFQLDEKNKPEIIGVTGTCVTMELKETGGGHIDPIWLDDIECLGPRTSDAGLPESGAPDARDTFSIRDAGVGSTKDAERD
ncbi:hypothetical protein LZC95_14295 [Pendulispora brunnea]|uniref:DUF7738 domain-containing protein n=1 Tax=Pendulispora brunnea TaxID=2905690 RepID=A0ABZ2KH44_9BACT